VAGLQTCAAASSRPMQWWRGVQCDVAVGHISNACPVLRCKTWMTVVLRENSIEAFSQNMTEAGNILEISAH
jgi:hypothetical protein